MLVSEPEAGRAALARQLGFALLDPREEDVAAACRARHEGGVDLAVECAGQPAGLLAALAALRPGGCVVQAGLIEQPVALDAMRLMLGGQSLVGSVGYPLDARPELLARIAGGLAVERVVTATVPFEDAVAGGFEPLAAGGAGAVKTLLEIGSA